MSNPFLNYNNGNSNLKVNNQKANSLGNISVALSTLPDVNISSVENAQQLTYNTTLQKWCNASASSVTTALQDLTDCDISNV